MRNTTANIVNVVKKFFTATNYVLIQVVIRKKY